MREPDKETKEPDIETNEPDTEMNEPDAEINGPEQDDTAEQHDELEFDCDHAKARPSGERISPTRNEPSESSIREEKKTHRRDEK